MSHWPLIELNEGQRLVLRCGGRCSREISEHIYVQPKHFFGHQKIWVNRWYQVNITDPERTALDLMVRCDIFGGMRAAIEILENALPQISTEKLVDYALQYKVRQKTRLVIGANGRVIPCHRTVAGLSCDQLLSA